MPSQGDIALIKFVNIGTEQNDLVRLKALGDAARETAAVRLHVLRDRLFLGHMVILLQNPNSLPHRVLPSAFLPALRKKVC
jgi:hypothetical protein